MAGKESGQSNLAFLVPFIAGAKSIKVNLRSILIMKCVVAAMLMGLVSLSTGSLVVSFSTIQALMTMGNSNFSIGSVAGLGSSMIFNALGVFGIVWLLSCYIGTLIELTVATSQNRTITLRQGMINSSRRVFSMWWTGIVMVVLQIMILAPCLGFFGAKVFGLDVASSSYALKLLIYVPQILLLICSSLTWHSTVVGRETGIGAIVDSVWRCYRNPTQNAVIVLAAIAAWQIFAYANLFVPGSEVSNLVLTMLSVALGLISSLIVDYWISVFSHFYASSFEPDSTPAPVGERYDGRIQRAA
jgi:hypothetical protein